MSWGLHLHPRRMFRSRCSRGVCVALSRCSAVPLKCDCTFSIGTREEQSGAALPLGTRNHRLGSVVSGWSIARLRRPNRARTQDRQPAQTNNSPSITTGGVQHLALAPDASLVHSARMEQAQFGPQIARLFGSVLKVDFKGRSDGDSGRDRDHGP